MLVIPESILPVLTPRIYQHAASYPSSIHWGLVAIAHSIVLRLEPSPVKPAIIGLAQHRQLTACFLDFDFCDRLIQQRHIRYIF